ncbi:MAG: hypothetical protein V6Z89_03780 [Desulfobacter sp.]
MDTQMYLMRVKPELLSSFFYGKLLLNPKCCREENSGPVMLIRLEDTVDNQDACERVALTM